MNETGGRGRGRPPLGGRRARRAGDRIVVTTARTRASRAGGGNRFRRARGSERRIVAQAPEPPRQPRRPLSGRPRAYWAGARMARLIVDGYNLLLTTGQGA